MYAAGSSNCLAERGNFQELHFAAPTEPTDVGDRLADHVSLHFSSSSSSSSGGTTSINGYGTHAPHKTVTFELQKSPAVDVEQRDCFTPPVTEQGGGGGDGPPAKLSKTAAPPAKKVDGGGRTGAESVTLPPEELLGSVTTFYPSGDPENGQTLRTSARVKHKMRMDSIRSSTPPLVERKEPAKPITSTLTKTPSQPKQMRVVWSNHDKNLFFEALNEYGKDFEAILNYLNTKKRRKDNGEQQVFKSKDVRNLYYQFNQKAMKYILFSDEVKREAQELYALINYGEMRRKVPFQNKKYFHKLKDLVYKGFTTVREKGKNIRIKTPSCRALRKLNQLEEWQEEIKLPPKVDVLLKPSTMEAWGRVQSLAQNPRVRITVTIQKRLSALLQLFQQKWRSQDVRLVDRLDEMKRLSVTVSSKIMRQRLQHEIQLFTQEEPVASGGGGSPVLRFSPAQNVTIHRPMISLTDFQSNTSICLNSYEQRIGVKVPGETLCMVEKPAGGCKDRLAIAGRRQRSDSGSEKMGNESKKVKYDDGGKETNEGKLEPLEELLPRNGGPTFEEHFKSPNASNESMELKDLIGYDADLCGSSRTSDFEVMLLGARQSDNSSDGFALHDGELGPVVRSYHQDTAESSAGEDGAIKSLLVVGANGTGGGGVEPELSTTNTLLSSTTTTTMTTTTTTTTTTTVTVKKKKKYHRRKGETSARSSSAASANHFRPLVSEEQMQRIRDGWTLASVGDLTVGDLYIMFGAEMKVELEYDWVREETSTVTTQRTTVVQQQQQQELKHECPPTDELGAPQEAPTMEEGKPTHTGPPEQEHVVIVESSSSSSCAVEEEHATTSVKEEIKDVRRCPVDNISRRLKNLLFLASLDNKDTKKRATNSAAERKPKRTESDGGIMPTQDNCLQFKHPMLPVRNPINHLVPDLLVPPRYKQSRWWRSRINRQTVHPLLLNMVRPPPTATVTSSSVAAATSAAATVDSQTKVVNASPVAAAPAPPPVSRVAPLATDEADERQVEQPCKRQEKPTTPPVKQTQEPARPNVITFDDLSLPNDLTGYSNPTSSNVPCGGRPVADELNTPVKKLAGEVLPHDLSLSLFDLSLPSTSCSMMANLFPDLVASGSAVAAPSHAALPEAIIDEKMVEANLADLSLSGIFSGLGPFPSPVRPPIDPDVDMTMMSESTVDYIARFQDIAAQFRTEQQHP